MTNQPKPTYAEREAARKAAEDELRTKLAAVDLDGPFDFPATLDPMAMLLGGARGRYAICLKCGAVVVLDDPQEVAGIEPIERGVWLHTRWHAEVAR